MPYYSDKGVFWAYTRDKLAWLGIAEPGPLAAVMHGIAAYKEKTLERVLWLRRQFIPTLADDDFVSYFGESRGVPRNRYDSAEKYRLRVERAFAWHAQAGKVKGLPRILAEYGFADGKIKNLRDDDLELWAHFEVVLLNPPVNFGLQDIAAVTQLANEHKPGRSVMSKVQFTYKNSAQLYAASVLTTSIFVQQRVEAEELKDLAPGALYAAATAVQYTTIKHEVNQI